MSKLESFVAKAKTQNDTIRAVAKELNTLMDQMGVDQLAAGGVRLRLATKRASGGGSTTDLEMLAVDDQYSGEVWVCVEVNPCASRSDSYHYGDFNCAFTRPTRGDLLQFAHAVPALLDKLLADVDAAQSVADTADMVIAAK